VEHQAGPEGDITGVVRDLSATLEAELRELAAEHRRRSCPELAGPSRVRPQASTGETLVSFSSNDYLGLASHPEVATAAFEAAKQEGFGAGAARLVSGDLPSHRGLEDDLASFVGRPAALLFPTGYQANLGAVTALAGPDDLIASDAANHASLIDGCRLSKATVAVFAHGDAHSAAQALARPGRYRRRLLITESIFSMDGDAAPLTALAQIAAAHDAILIVDEAHALGVVGPGGRGLCAATGTSPDVVVGTLGKAFGAAGGFVAGSAALKDYLLNRARTFVFTTSSPPPVAAAARAALRLARGSEGDQRRHRLGSLQRRFIDQLGDKVVLSPGPIQPVILGTDERALEAAAHLRRRGLFVPAIRPPTVPSGTARLRLTFSSEHTEAEVDLLARALLEILV
jgi:8-amino-7-oxononanoate synthase